MNQVACNVTYDETRFKNVCPKGWKVPSNQEWTDLTEYVGSIEEYRCASDPTYIARALASTSSWIQDIEGNFCAPGADKSSNNATGFTALPAGRFKTNGTGTTNSEGYEAIFWSSTQNNVSTAFTRAFYNGWAIIDPAAFSKNYGMSVRCIKD